MSDFSSVREIIELWETRAALAESLGVPVGRVHKWALHNSVPSRYLWDVLESARDAGFSVSAEDLLRANAAVLDSSALAEAS